MSNPTILKVKAYGQYIYSIGTDALIYFQAVDIYGQPFIQEAVLLRDTQDLTTTPYLTFTNVADAVAYYAASHCATLLTTVNTNAGTTVYLTTDLELVDTPVAAALSMLAPVATSGAYADLTGKPTIPTFTAQPHIANVSVVAANNNPTNYTLLSGILGVATGLNTANANQNAMADQLNDLTTKYNTLLAHLVTLTLQS